jgi:hypothetical protein
MSTHQFLFTLAAMSGVMHPTIAPASDFRAVRQRARSLTVPYLQHPFRPPRLPLSSTSGAKPVLAAGSPRTTSSTGVFENASCRCTRRLRVASGPRGWQRQMEH